MIEVDSFLSHYGVKGMQWGKRKDRVSLRDAQIAGNHVQSVVAKAVPKNAMSDSYSNLKSDTQILEAGFAVVRISNHANEQLKDITYASHTPKDVQRYTAIIPDFHGLGNGQSFPDSYQHTYVTTKRLTLASPKARVDAFANLMDAREVPMADGSKVTGREYLTALGYSPEITSLDKHQLGKQLYDNYVVDQYADTPLNTAYFGSLRKQGYDALVDDNNKGIIADEPLIILDPVGKLERMAVRKLSNQEINEAQKNFSLPSAKEVMLHND